MGWILAGRVGTVVTVDTAARDRRVIESCGQPAGRRVAIVTGIAAWDVCRVFADCGESVMAGAARTDDLCVIDSHHRRKHVGRMAVFAGIRRIDMPDIFAGRFGAVVAADTVAHDIQVIKIRRCPAKRAVAVIAGITAGDVPRVLASRQYAVVAGAAHANNLAVIHGHYWRKDVGGMAVLTDIRGLDMCRIFAGRVYAVMAADTITHDIHMVEIRRQPGHGAVAIVTIVAAGDVPLVFSGCCEAIMAGAATAQHLRVINDCHWHERNGRMTVFADVGRANVRCTFPDCIDVVMARSAAAHYLGVVDCVHWRENIRIVAIFANIGGLHMQRILAHCLGAVMAAEAVIGNVGVIKKHREPAHGAVAIVTSITAGNVSRVLASRGYAVVARTATANDLRMVNHNWRNPYCWTVAILADVG